MLGRRQCFRTEQGFAGSNVWSTKNWYSRIAKGGILKYFHETAKRCVPISVYFHFCCSPPPGSVEKNTDPCPCSKAMGRPSKAIGEAVKEIFQDSVALAETLLGCPAKNISKMLFLFFPTPLHNSLGAVCLFKMVVAVSGHVTQPIGVGQPTYYEVAAAT